jgi:hypothetical protein
MTIIKELPNNSTPTTICSANPYDGVFVATFTSAAECNSYAQAPVVGAPSAIAYSNCSAASYCISFNSPLVGSLEGYSLAGVTAQAFSYAALEFSTEEGCTNAIAQGVMTCVGNPPYAVCNNSSLVISDCTFNNDPIGSFSIPGNVGDILTFDLLP